MAAWGRVCRLGKTRCYPAKKAFRKHRGLERYRPTGAQWTASGMRLEPSGMKRRTPTLIKSPLTWQMATVPVAHPAIPVLAERGGTQLRAPRATVVVDTREQNPFDFLRFEAGLMEWSGER